MGRVIFCAIVLQVELDCGPDYRNCCCGYLQRRQWKFMFMELVLCVMMVLLSPPTDVEFSHWMGVWGCGHPISMRSWCIVIISLAMVKRPASSDLAADDMTFLMIWDILRTGLLWCGTSTSSESMMWAPARMGGVCSRWGRRRQRGRPLL